MREKGVIGEEEVLVKVMGKDLQLSTFQLSAIWFVFITHTQKKKTMLTQNQRISFQNG